MISYTPPPADQEAFRVLILRDALADSRRDGRTVPFKLYYPVDHGLDSLPVIVWSHGLGGSRDGAAFLARYLAAQGFIVVNIQHRGTDSSLWEGKPGHPWDVIRATPISRAVTWERFRDVSFVIDHLPGWLKRHPDLYELINMDRIGMSGHSYGALTTQVMMGQAYPDERGDLATLPEPRFKAAILYSPTPLLSQPESIYELIDRPVLHLTGDADISPVEGFGYDKRLRVFENSGGPDQYLAILRGGDHMVFTGSRGQLEENPNRDLQEGQIKTLALAFWRAYLLDDRSARIWLDQGGAAAYLGETGHLTRRA